MENIMGISEEAKKKSYEYKEEWDRNNTRRANVKFNVRTDADIIERLDQVGSFSKYIKKLIREDIARNTGTRLTVTASKPDTEISDDFTEPE